MKYEHPEIRENWYISFPFIPIVSKVVLNGFLGRKMLSKHDKQEFWKKSAENLCRDSEIPKFEQAGVQKVKNISLPYTQITPKVVLNDFLGQKTSSKLTSDQK